MLKCHGWRSTQERHIRRVKEKSLHCCVNGRKTFPSYLGWAHIRLRQQQGGKSAEGSKKTSKLRTYNSVHPSSTKLFALLHARQTDYSKFWRNYLSRSSQWDWAVFRKIRCGSTNHKYYLRLFHALTLII